MRVLSISGPLQPHPERSRRTRRASGKHGPLSFGVAQDEDLKRLCPLSAFEGSLRQRRPDSFLPHAWGRCPQGGGGVAICSQVTDLQHHPPPSAARPPPPQSGGGKRSLVSTSGVKAHGARFRDGRSACLSPSPDCGRGGGVRARWVARMRIWFVTETPAPSSPSLLPRPGEGGARGRLNCEHQVFTQCPLPTRRRHIPHFHPPRSLGLDPRAQHPDSQRYWERTFRSHVCRDIG